MLKSRSKYPPGGWKFIQPQTGWKSDSRLSFDQVVNSIISHRRSNSRFNLPTDFDSVANELEVYTEKRLRAMPKTEDWYTDAGGDVVKKAPAAKRPNALAAVAESIKRTSAGIRTLVDWLGSGAKPVDSATAFSRAEICSRCELNQKGSIRQWIQAKAAADFQSLLGIAKDLKLSTPLDESLEICQACDCHLPLKIWVPLSHIKKNTSPEVYSKLPPHCWILKE